MAVIPASKLAEYLQAKTKKAQKTALAKWKTAATPIVKEEINAYLDKGISPVSGNQKFKKYSDSYKGQIKGTLSFFTKGGKVIPFTPSRPTIPQKNNKKLSPVNLKLTGLLRASLKVKSITAGLSVYFSDKKAKYINNPQSGSTMPRRAILPLTGEKFKKKIIERLETLYVKTFKL